MEINNYYEIQDVYNKTHICKLISIDNTKNIFKDLGNNQEFEIDNKIIFREASINNHHLKELHFFKNNKYVISQGLHIFPVYGILGEKLTNLELKYFGYVVITEKDFETQLSYIKSMYNEFLDNNVSEKTFIQNINSISSVNKLFEMLESHGLEIFNKDEILK